MRLSSGLLLCVIGMTLLLCLINQTEAARVNQNARLRHARAKILSGYDDDDNQPFTVCCNSQVDDDPSNNSTSSDSSNDDGDDPNGDGGDGGEDDSSQGKVTVVANNNALNLDEQAAQLDAAARAKKLQKEAEKRAQLQLQTEETKQKEEDQKLKEKDEEEKKRHHQEQETKLQEQVQKRADEQLQKADAKDKESKGKAQGQRAMVPANCILWGSSHYVTFKKTEYDLYSSGEFVLATDPDFNEQINVLQQKPHSNFPVSYATGLAFRSGNHEVSIQYLRPRSEFNVRLYIDNKEFNFYQGQVLHAGDLQVNVHWQRDQDWTDKLLVTIISSASGTTVEIRANQHEKFNEHMVYFNVKVAAKGYTTGNVRTGGLCGRYEPESQNHLVTSTGETVTDPVKMALTWIVPSTQSLFSEPAKLDPISWTDVKNSKNLTPEQLANGDKELVDKAMKSCFSVPEPTRSNCVIDYLAGGGRATVAEAFKMAKVEQRQ